MKNVILDTLATRWSVRAYTSQPLSGEQVEAIGMAALASPSAANSQPWKIIAVTNSIIIDEIETAMLNQIAKADDPTMIEWINSHGGRVMYNAPVVYFIAMRGNSSTDCGIVAENISIAASSMGLGSVILGCPRMIFGGESGTYWCDRLGFPEGYGYGLAVAVGYAASDGSPHELDKNKFTIID